LRGGRAALSARQAGWLAGSLQLQVALMWEAAQGGRCGSAATGGPAVRHSSCAARTARRPRPACEATAGFLRPRWLRGRLVLS
jgi:hypothetical protein